MNTLTHEQLENLKENGRLIPRDVIERIARITGPGSAAQQVLDALDLHEPKGFIGHVIEDGHAFVVLWEAKVDG